MRRAASLLMVALITFWGAPASAFTTRVHIVLANEVIEALEASGDGTIRLRWSTYSVQIPQTDADAILHEQMSFRAGAIGPDNTVFPAMTDGTHGVEQDPYRQCQMLYDEAFTESERAYALGCFLHGSTDAIAHHFVNHFTGETFTLTPITEGRESSYENVIGHIVTESAIQGAIYESDPSAFSSAALDHEIPQDFVLRTYFDVDSPVWQRLTEHSMTRWRAAQAADPDGNITSWIGASEFAIWEQIAMAPQYVEEIERLRTALRAYMVDRIATLATDPAIDAMPGPDGMIGTPDDETACTASCPDTFGEYWILVNLLAPRFDTSGNPLPSAFDKISDDLGANLYEFMPAFVQVIQNVSTELNAGVTDDEDHGLDFDRDRLDTLFAPVDDWADRTFTIDWTSAGRAVSPAWYDDLSDFLSMFSVRVTIPDLLAILFQPIVDEIRDALILEVRERAEVFVDELKTEYELRREPAMSRVTEVLETTRPPALDGTMLDHVQDSGLLAHAFNITAATLANHEIMLVDGDPIANGPTSFDASYTPEWTQLGLCEYLREAVFPHGIGLRPLLSVEEGATFYGAVMPGDSPIECHDGSLESFGTPSVESCAHTDLASLLVTAAGSLTRAYPPAHAHGEPGCRYLTVPGLPPPPVLPDAGVPPGTDGGTPMTGDGGTTTSPPVTTGACGCAVIGANDDSSSGAWLAVIAIGLVALRRRKRLRPASIGSIAALLLIATGCEPATTLPADSGTTPVDAHVPGNDTGTPPEDDAGVDAAEPVDSGPPDTNREDFLAALDGTVWSAPQTRTEMEGDVERAYELHFEGGTEPKWGEIRNPYGPARLRVLRFMRIGAGDCASATECEVSTTITIADASWETPSSLRGRMEDWTVEIIDGAPRTLSIRNADSGVEEIFEEGAWPEPTSGLTAEVRVFEGGSGNPISDAFCTSGAIFSSDIDRAAIWDFARGLSSEPTLGQDHATGVALAEWNDVSNRFGIRDVDGFRIGDFGGSLRTDQFYFVVRYRGSVDHPGGPFQMQEADDEVEDAVWAFIGSNVGSTDVDDLFLEVHHFAAPDETPDEPSVTLPAGEIPIEIIIPRCEMDFEASGQVRVEMRLGSAGYDVVSSQPIRPLIDDTLFPPVL